MPSKIKQQIDSQVKDAMRAKDKQRLGVLRLTMSEIKRIEVDERIELDDTRVLAILDKMIKQRKDSLDQFQKADRKDLADQEAYELSVLSEYLPDQLDESEIEQLVLDAVKATGAKAMQDMGKVMAALRPNIQGRADMGQVSSLVKAQLG